MERIGRRLEIVGVAMVAMLPFLAAAAETNTYVLDGTPTGLTTPVRGQISFAKGTYLATAHGPNAAVRGPARFRFRWRPDPDRPEPPPLTAIVTIETEVQASDPTSAVVRNGWKTFRGQTAELGLEVEERIVMVRPGHRLEVPVQVFALVGPRGTGCRVRVQVKVTPVRATLQGVTWLGAPKMPQVLMGTRVRGALIAPGADLSSVEWSVSGDKFASYDPYVTPSPKLHLLNAPDLTNPQPAWSWKGLMSARHTVRATASVEFPGNRFNPKVATVSDDFTVGVVRPIVTVQMLTLDDRPLPETGYVKVRVEGTRTVTPGGTVKVPKGFSEGGYFAFVHVVFRGTKDRGRLDGGFPYAYGYVRAAGEPAKFLDWPLKPSERVPLTPDSCFTTYIVFKPNGTDTQWVPLAKLNWSWDLATGALRLPPSPKWTPTDDFPKWFGAYELKLNPPGGR